MKKLSLIMLSLIFSITVCNLSSYAKVKHDDDWYEQWGQQQVTLSDSNVILYVGGEKDERVYELTVDLDPNHEDIKWTSSDSKIATVNSEGVVKAKKKGSCTITATGEESGQSSSCYIDVRSEPVPVEEAKTTNDGELIIAKTRKEKLPFKLLPSGHTAVKYNFRVEDTDVCSVDSNGMVYGREHGDTVVHMWFSNEEKGGNEWSSIPEEAAEFHLKFQISVIEYDKDRFNKWNEDYKGFYSNTTTEDGEFIWRDVKDVGWILYDGSIGEYVSGWQSVGGKWYYLKADDYKTKDYNNDTARASFSVMQTGWLKDGDNWFLLGPDGSMKQGWAMDNGKWYYLDPVSGVMDTGITQMKGKWYYLRDDGSAVEGWWTNPEDGQTYYGNKGTCELPSTWFLVDGKWYYSDTFKFYAMKNQWVKDSLGNDYYLTETGEMLVNGTTPDGYQVGSDGKIVY